MKEVVMEEIEQKMKEVELVMASLRERLASNPLDGVAMHALKGQQELYGNLLNDYQELGLSIAENGGTLE